MRSGPPDERLAELLVQAELTAARLVGRVDAEDIASEAVVRAVLRWRRVSDFPHAWVTRVATNLAVDLLRKRARARSRSEMDRTPPGGFESVVAQRLEVVRELRCLSRRQQEMVVLHYLEGFTSEEISQVLGLSMPTAKTHISRARRAMQHVNGRGGDGERSRRRRIRRDRMQRLPTRASSRARGARDRRWQRESV